LEREIDALDLTQRGLVLGACAAGQQVFLDLVEPGQHFRVDGGHLGSATSSTEMILSGISVSNGKGCH
jgi:hypothetical protein